MLVADAQPVTRSGLRHLIESHAELRFCAETENLLHVRELCSKSKPAVLVLDPTMGDGFTIIRDVRRSSARTQVVAFTALVDASSVQRAFKAGACACITRLDPVATLMAAIVGAVSGERHVGPGLQGVLVDQLTVGGGGMRERIETALSTREMEVFRLLGEGNERREIAGALRMSVKTVESHKEHIKEKLRLATGTEMRRQAILYMECSKGPADSSPKRDVSRR